MTEEEKIAAEQAAIEAAKAKETTTVDPIAEKDAKIAKLEEERDNYKAVALKRLGKLPNDAEFMGATNEEGTELSVAEQVRQALLDKEIELEKKAREEEVRKILRENQELKLALKNRPNESIGGDSGGGNEVKDNVFSTEQIAELRRRASRLNVDPDKFVENAKKNLLSRK